MFFQFISQNKGKIIVIALLIYVALLIIFYLPHKQTGESYQREFAKRSFTSSTTGTERIAYITDNTDALLYRLRMIEEAQDSIIMSTFDFNCDESGKDIMAALLHAADRGVKVQVIVDGISGLLDMKGNPYFLALASHENITLKRYNPINLLKPWKVQARLHDKYLIIDHSMYLLGGRNTMDLFLGNYSNSQNEDRELFVYETNRENIGSLAQVEQYFQHIWNLADSKTFSCKHPGKKVEKHLQILRERYRQVTTLYPSTLEVWDWTNLTMETNRIELLSNPIEAKNKEPHMWYSLAQLMKTGKNIRIYTPYIICSKDMYTDLAEICKNSEQVEILTNDVASGANPFGCTDYLNQRKKIWNTGAQVYEYLGTCSSHTKIYLIGDRLSAVGSYNLDMRSSYLDTELMLVVDSAELNTIITQEFETDKTYSKTMAPSGKYTYGENYQPVELSIWKKMLYALLRLLVLPLRRIL